MIPAVIMLLVRWLLGTPDEFLAMPANGIPPTRMDGLVNLATALCVWFGVQAFLASLVRHDSEALANTLIVLMLVQAPFFGCSGLLMILW